MTERAGPQAGDPDLDELRAELVRFVLREAGQAVVADPSLPLSAALTRAIREEAERAAQRAREGQPTAENLAANVMRAVRPELVQIVRAAARGDAVRIDRTGLRGWIASTPATLVAMTAIAGLLVAFALGFGAAWMLASGSAAVDLPAVSQPTVPAAVDDPAAGQGDDPTVSTDVAAAAPSEPLVQEPTP